MAKKSLVERMDKFLGGAILEASANFDNDFTGLGKDLGDCNKTLSDQNWNQRLREIDAANQSKLQEKNDKLLELIRKANVIFADMSKEYWNARHKEDATNKLPPNKKYNQFGGGAGTGNSGQFTRADQTPEEEK